MAGKILVIRGGAIGDFVLTLPVFSALRKAFPQARVEILGYPPIAVLAVPSGLAMAVNPLESPHLASFFTEDSELDSSAKDYFASFDVILSYAFDPQDILQKNIKKCSGARFVKAMHRPNDSGSLHATEFFLEPLRQLGIENADPVPRLNLPEPTRLVMDHGCIAVHPGSGSLRKNWPEANWLQLLSTILARTPLDCLLVGGEAEGDRLMRFAKTLGTKRVMLAQGLPLAELAQKLHSCTAFLGHDSGISHLAAAVGLDGIVLWAETNDKVWRPRSDRMKILKGVTDAQLEPGTVFSQLEQMLASVQATRY